MSINEGSPIDFYQGTKEKLEENLNVMKVGDLAIATDEMQWYMVIEQESQKVLVRIN